MARASPSTLDASRSRAAVSRSRCTETATLTAKPRGALVQAAVAHALAPSGRSDVPPLSTPEKLSKSSTPGAIARLFLPLPEDEWLSGLARTAPDVESAPVPDVEPALCGELESEDRSGLVVHWSPPLFEGGLGVSCAPGCGSEGGVGSLGGGGGDGSLGGAGSGAGSVTGVTATGGPSVGGAGGAGSAARAVGTTMLSHASTSAISAKPRAGLVRRRFEGEDPEPKACDWCVRTPLNSFWIES